ncbi:hypothetical protein GCM10008957_44240 [Deinococcus ruber]|uniref:HTH luxR-type domain-containing protein n=1 Tax=Deinococcus ruber TaxID=1848197 RepID=A0A918CLU5_9DEIO|nr:hypothetical protein GCM10008957_44240 [Deinococcus ruber]
MSAPVGFGKTTLLSEWATDSGRRPAWLSLDAADSDPARFLLYLVAALQTVVPDIGREVVGALQAAAPPPAEVLLTALLNEVAALSTPVLLVLDDYHLLDAAPVDHALSFLIDHLPPTLHVAVATREDPRFPLARWRAQGQLTEVRASDLRFTAAEAAEFLGQLIGPELSEPDIVALEERTEGWIAGLQLAALSMRGRTDLPAFVRAFSGDNRYIIDYLAEEVLQRQPEPVRQFLLQTAILERLSGPLCDAVTGQTQGSAQLQALERGNFFVVALDDQREWYRYHHLFGDVLALHLKAEQPARVAALHGRASVWFEQQGLAHDAVRHALAADDAERAATLIERLMPQLRRSREEAALLNWLRVLPEPLLRARPVLSVYYAGALLVSGRIREAQTRLKDAERWLGAEPDGVEGGPLPATEMVVVDEQEFSVLAASIAIYRAGIALALGDLTGTIRAAQQVLKLVPADDHLRRGSARGFLGIAAWTRGELEQAEQSYTECVALVQKAEYLSDALGCAAALADLQRERGRLRGAMHTYERGLHLATTDLTGAVVRGAADMQVGMSELQLERGDVKAAAQHLRDSKTLGEFAGLPPFQFRWCLAQARVQWALGELDAALKLFDEAEQHAVLDFLPVVRPVAALRVRVWTAQGRLNEALGWVNGRGLSVHGDPGYLNEFEYLTLARVLLAQARANPTESALLELHSLLERLLRGAEAGGRIPGVIESLLLQALALQVQGTIQQALVPLLRALHLAQPEGYVRLIVDEGAPMAALLRHAAKRASPLTPYLQHLLTACGERVGDAVPPVAQQPGDPLSARELDVLRRLGSELDGPSLARELHVSLNTLRTHTRNIYSKLGVNSRRAAVRRAQELGLA